MSNAKQRAVDSLRATFARISGVSIAEADQSAELVVESLIAAMGACKHDTCEKWLPGGECGNAGPCIYHTGRPRLVGCLAECHISASECEYRDKLHPTCYAQKVCRKRVVVAVPVAQDAAPFVSDGFAPPCINSECPDWGSGDICKAATTCSNRVVAASSGGVESLKPDPAPCNEPCINNSCLEQEGDICRDADVCEDRIEPDTTTDACNESCANSKCEFNEEDGNLCLQLEPCGLIMAPDTLPPCEEPCSKTVCGENEGGLLCMAPSTCPDHSEPEERLQGYTLEEWEQIRAGGYFCQFSPDGVIWSGPISPVKIATNVGDKDLKRFVSSDGDHWDYCRPAEIPGVLRPWFGGDCPVPDDTQVMVVLYDGSTGVQQAGTLMWQGPEHLPSSAIKAFMVLPE